MAPPHKSVAELGTVSEHGNGWRARVMLDGQYRCGPQRATCAEAQADLDAARQCTSREEMSKFLTSGAQSMKRPRQMDPSSGDLHPAAESGANLAVEEAHSEKPAGLNTESSGVPQPAASCHEPRAPMVFMKILEPIWAAEVADGQKMFECVAN